MKDDDDRGARRDGEPGDDEPGDDELLETIGSAFARKGELFPTTEDEVLDAEEALGDLDEALPPGLAAYREVEPKASPEAPAPAASRRIVSLDEERQRRRAAMPSWATHVLAVSLGAAAAAAALTWTTDTGPPELRPPNDPAAATSASSAPPDDRLEVGPVLACTPDCCAGADCAAAEGELRECGSRRTCIPCAAGTSSGAQSQVYRVRIGQLFPTDVLAPADLDHLDLCVKVGSSEWSCAPARVDPAEEPEWRTLPRLATGQDTTNGVTFELRFQGTKEVIGRWHNAVRVNPTTLCRGVGVALESKEGKTIGSLSFFLDDAQYVELRRARDVAALKQRRQELAFADVTPMVVETSTEGARRFALVVGPLDRDAAERLRWRLLELGEDARVTTGRDYVGEPQRLK